MYEELYAQNKGLLHMLAERWRGACKRDRAVSVEDLVQAGFFGLVKASETYNPSMGKGWTWWATWFIVREFEGALCLSKGKPMQPHTSAVALDAPIKAEDSEGITLGDTLQDESLPDTDEITLRNEVRFEVRAAVARLEDDAQRKAVELHDLEDKTLMQTAEVMALPVNRVKGLRVKAHIILRKDVRLRVLADLDDRTRFYAHKGVAAFERDWTSVTEGAALWRIEQQGGL